MIHDLVDDKRTLYVSTDFGSTYQEVSSFTKSFFLKYGESNDKTEIFIQRFHPAEGMLSDTHFFLELVSNLASFNHKIGKLAKHNFSGEQEN